MKKKNFKMTVLILVALMFISLILYLSWGTYKIGPLDIINTLFGGGTKLQKAALLNTRLPRLLVGISVGIALSTAGALLQTITKMN